MATLQTITNKLLAINETIFQELCDALLAIKIKNYNAFTRSGSHKTKQKTIKGVPDSFMLLADGSYLFIESTTTDKTRLLKKLINDVNDCIKVASNLKIRLQGIILCFNSDLLPSDIEKINILCKNSGFSNPNYFHLSRIALDIHLQHRYLAKEYLGLNLDTGQIVPVGSFIKQYNQSGQRLATPIGKSCLYREESLNEIVNFLNTSDIVVITGPAGVGKTQLAIEGINRFCDKYQEFISYSILNKDADLLEDLYSYFENAKNIILFVDDINRFNKFSQLLSFCTENNLNRFKLILTVRDYALENISDYFTSFRCDYHQIRLKKLTDAEITGIINQSPYNIKNQEYQDLILNIADGNPRIAIMLSLLANQKQDINALRDIKDLFKLYFNTFIVDNKSVLKAKENLHILAIISFFNIINYEDSKFMERVSEAFEIKSEKFLNALPLLENLELIEIYKSHVKIAEQNLAVYFFFKIFIEESQLSFKNLLTYFFHDFKQRFSDIIVPVTNYYNYFNIKEKIAKDLKEHLRELKEETVKLAFLEQFWFFLYTETLAFILKSCEACSTPEYTYFETELKSNHSYHNEDRIIRILGDMFRNNYKLNDVLEVAFTYVSKKPELLPELISKVISQLTYDLNDEYINFNRQRILIEYLSTGIKNNDKIVSASFFPIAEELLKFSFQKTRSGRGDSIQIYRYSPPVNDEIISQRKILFDLLADCLKEHEIKTLNILISHGSGTLDFNKKMFEADLNVVLKIIEKNLSTKEFKHCYYVRKLADWSERNELFPIKLKKLRNRFKNRELQWFNLIQWDFVPKKGHQEEIKWDTFNSLKEKELRESISFSTFTEYTEFVQFVKKLLQWPEPSQVQGIIGSFDIIIEEALITNPTLGLEYFIYYIADEELQKHYLHRTTTYLANGKEISEKCYQVLISKEVRDHWILSYLYVLEDDKITKQQSEHLYKVLQAPNCNLYIIFSQLKKFQKFNANLFEDLLKMIVQSNEKDDVCLSIEYDFFSKFSDQIKDLDLLKKAYKQIQKRELSHSFDYNGKQLYSILLRDPYFINDYLYDWMNKFEYISAREFNEVGIIWKTDQHDEILDRVILTYFIEEDKYYIHQNILKAFFNKNLQEKDRAHSYLLKRVSMYYSNPFWMKIIFKVIIEEVKEIFEDAFSIYINNNQNLKDFKQIQWIGSGGVYSGKVNFGDMHAARWLRILDLVRKEQLGIKVLQIEEYVEYLIDAEKKSGERERLRDFLTRQ